MMQQMGTHASVYSKGSEVIWLPNAVLMKHMLKCLKQLILEFEYQLISLTDPKRGV